jgi:hypothetical protein
VAELSEHHKEAIVLLLARYRTPAEVALVMREEFELELAIQQIVKYDPSRPVYEAGERWLPVFEAARKAYIEDAAAVPVANQGFRLNLLQQGIDAAKKSKNWKLVAELTEQASKEVGGVFTNIRDLNVNQTGRARRELLASAIAEHYTKTNGPQPQATDQPAPGLQ